MWHLLTEVSREQTDFLDLWVTRVFSDVKEDKLVEGKDSKGEHLALQTDLFKRSKKLLSLSLSRAVEGLKSGTLTRRLYQTMISK